MTSLPPLPASTLAGIALRASTGSRLASTLAPGAVFILDRMRADGSVVAWPHTAGETTADGATFALPLRSEDADPRFVFAPLAIPADHAVRVLTVDGLADVAGRDDVPRFTL